MSTITFRNVDEAFGGTSIFDNSCERTKLGHIGTHGLIYCVGLYLPISDTKCFFAHINAYAEDSIGSMRRDSLTEAQGNYIRNEVFEKLAQAAINGGWSKDDVLECLGSTGRKIVVMCPCLTDETNRPGKFVLQGLELFLGEAGCFDTRLCESRNMKKGFVVEHATGAVYLLEHNSCLLSDPSIVNLRPCVAAAAASVRGD